MAETKDSRTKKGYTPPKGAPTPRRNAPEHGMSRRRYRFEWAVVIVALVAITFAVFIFGSGTGSHSGGGGFHSGAGPLGFLSETPFA